MTMMGVYYLKIGLHDILRESESFWSLILSGR